MRIFVSVLLLAFCAACLNVPNSMHVQKGQRPENVDDHVRFRTTLYFRSFDYCMNKAQLDRRLSEASALTDPLQKDYFIIPGTDSLYRFKLTGKAASATTKVKFESGTLPASVIDPFGASVEVDPSTGRPRFLSKQEQESRTARQNSQSEFKELVDLIKEIDATGVSNAAVLKAKVETRLADVVDNYGGRKIPSTKSNEAGFEGRSQTNVNVTLYNNSDVRASEAAVPVGTSNCVAGPVRRGFQIMGPEGWRTFRQDERILLAMSSSAEPLIQSLQRTSDNILNSKASNADIALPLLREEVVIDNLLRKVSAAAPQKDEDVTGLYDGVISDVE